MPIFILLITGVTQATPAPERGNFTHRHGFLFAADLIPPEPATLSAALSKCGAMPKCTGISYQAEAAEPADLIREVHYKDAAVFGVLHGWHTWQKAAFALPDPTLNNLCLAAAPGPWKEQPWCDPTLPLGERVADMLRRMSLDEKIGNLGTSSKPIASLGLLPYEWYVLLYICTYIHELKMLIDTFFAWQVVRVVARHCERLARRAPADDQLRLPDHHRHVVQPVPVARDRGRHRDRGTRADEHGRRGLDLLGAGDL